MTISEQINIAFAIDEKYTPHLEALIKSICYYNKNVNFYVLHNDIPQEWFEGIRFKLEKIGNNLFSIHISDDIFKGYKTLEVNIEGLGYFFLAAQSKGAAKMEDFTAQDITGLRICFRANNDIRLHTGAATRSDGLKLKDVDRINAGDEEDDGSFVEDPTA